MSLAEAVAEWDNVAEIEPAFSSSAKDSSVAAPFIPQSSAPISVEEAVQHFKQTIAEPPSTLTDSGLPVWLWKLLPCCTSPRLSRGLVQDRSLVGAIAKCSFDDSDPMHLRMLQTLYRSLTGNAVDCPRFGGHWEDIGFQVSCCARTYVCLFESHLDGARAAGNDPATDLRGMGCLSLVQALFLVSNPDLLAFARKLMALSRDEVQNFPLMVLAINITRIAFDALRRGRLNKVIHTAGELWNTFNFYYASVLFYYYNRWKTEHLTIRDSGNVLQDTEAYCHQNVSAVLSEFKKHLIQQ